MPYNLAHMAKMATPRGAHPLHIPDKASVYWVDYLLDERPHKIRDAEELYDYYQEKFSKFPRSDHLAEPRPWTHMEEYDKDITEFGIPVSALKYVASQRIYELANPVKRGESENLKVIRLPPIGEKYKLRAPTWFQDDSKSGMDTTDMFNRHPRSRRPIRATAYDLARGDFRSRSRQNRRTVEGKQDSSVPRLPPIDRDHSKLRSKSTEVRDKKPKQSALRLPPLQTGQGEGAPGFPKKWR